jgi:glyceraldehyde-3-phosphate dehydrogenase (NADP+)
MSAEYQMYCAGEFRRTEQQLDVTNPHNGKVVARICMGSVTDLDDAIVKAAMLRDELRNMSSAQRYSVLMEISAAIAAEGVRLAELLSAESAKPLRYALAEVDRAAQTFIVAAEEAKRLPKEYISLDWTPAGKNREGLVKYFPAGIIAGISPFNFPLNLAVHKIAPAIAAGCPIILKPATSTPLSTLELAKIIDRTSLPKGAVSIIPMDRETGNKLVTDDRIAVLSFTGSPEVGWKMKSQAGRKKIILELGGNAGVIVTPSADFETAVAKCVTGGFAYSGQICIHAQRIYIHESLFDRFVIEFCKRAELLKVGDPSSIETDISSMIDETNAKRVEQWVNEAVEAGAKLLCGGKRNGSYFEPTVLTGTDVMMKVNCEEVFGPVVVVEKYNSFAEAIALINNSKFGLQAGIFTNDIRESDNAFNEIECGGVILNDVPTLRFDHMPYGGVKDSGSGREGVKYAILDFMEPRILVK